MLIHCWALNEGGPPQHLGSGRGPKREREKRMFMFAKPQAVSTRHATTRDVIQSLCWSMMCASLGWFLDGDTEVQGVETA